MTLRSINVWDIVLTLGGVYGDEVVPGGSGFLLRFGLGVTAAHIFDEHFERYSQRINRKNTEADYPVVAAQIVEKGAFALQWGVKNLFRMPSFADNDSPIDLALVELVPLSPEMDGQFARRRHLQPIVSLSPPSVGSKVKGYGYIQSAVQGTISDLTWTHRHRAAEGKVTKIHYPVRDWSSMAFPCFEADAAFDPGMSGGPVFNSDGRICGMVSRGMTFGEDSVSWASSIWPAMGIQIHGASLYELAQSQLVRVEDLECVKVTRVSGREFPDIAFDPNISRHKKKASRAPYGR